MSDKEKIISKLGEAFLPENVECDGGACMKCWKDIVREAMKMLNAYEQPITKEESRWINVETKLPEHGIMALCISHISEKVMEHPIVGCYYPDTKTWTTYDISGSNHNDEVYFWQPLPNPPKIK